MSKAKAYHAFDSADTHCLECAQALEVLIDYVCIDA